MAAINPGFAFYTFLKKILKQLKTITNTKFQRKTTEFVT